MNDSGHRVGLLLGAGFSVPAGYPTGAQLTEALRHGERMVIGHHPEYDTIRNIVRPLTAGRCACSYSYEEMLSDMDRARASVRSHRSTWPDGCAECDSFFAGSDGLRALRQHLDTNPEDLDKAYYALLFALHDNLHPMYHPGPHEYVSRWLTSESISGPLSVVNLNHDELVWMNSTANDLDHLAGFVDDAFDALDAEAWSEAAHVNGYKLHGSPSWYRLRDGSTGELTPLRRSAPVAGIGDMEARGQIVVGRTADKTRRINGIEELDTISRRAAQALDACDALVIVGYSGGDEHVNELITRFVQRTHERSIVVDRCPAAVRDKLHAAGVPANGIRFHEVSAEAMSLDDALALLTS